ncbi:putative acidocalcisomal exopolyphosphatase [Trypanosoma theileri]|uniref:Putative acidocalcisomal exopolyphosphatase n=1 Tax=Trypanosoma theileri TaxID=67003 RepID=A0A1X0P2Z3_9TRYP|nr:putative acidocalcisomal exopolyphosphatase [Trypanosoma theileri]ORC91221.1 putative acidocalcisomal exopolyphosphatase [Trypanosoma theileri]
MAMVINDFLRRCFQFCATQKSITIVLGNEGGDMDSIVGSIYLAFFLEKRDLLGGKYYIPLLNFEKEDLPLRNDVVKLFSKYGVETNLLLSSRGNSNMEDYVDLKKMMPDVVLYDHNKLIAAQTFLSEKVIGIVDHHFDEQLYIEQTKRLRLLETTGSACTLVAELFRDAGLKVPCAELLLAPIILDTVNFNPSQKKVTERDIQVTQWLVGQLPEKIDLEEMFVDLSKWKKDIMGLSFAQHLRRDYKHFEFPFHGGGAKCLQIGISSISCRLDEMVASRSMTELASGCLEFVNSRHLDALILALAGERGSGNYCRQLAFIAKGDVLDVLESYAKSSPDMICFTPLSTVQDGEWSMISYELSDPSVSRKKLAPSLAKYIAAWPKL